MAGIIKAVNESKSKQSTQEQILNGFQAIRDEQKLIATKISENDMEENELKVVISTLEKVEENRKCFRLIGGVLCEKTVKDVLPVLLERRDELAKLQVKLKEELMKKGVDLNEYKEKHNIKIQGQDDHTSSSGDKTETAAPLQSAVLNA